MRHHSALIAFIFILSQAAAQDIPSCDSKIFCQGNLLHTIQMAGIFNDSKSFVDMKLVNSVEKTLENFEVLMNETAENPNKEQIIDFVNENFEDYNEFEDWTPPDFVQEPDFLSKITDQKIKEFAKNLINIWPTLARKVKQEVKDSPEQFSLIPVEHGFVIPGGRFKEFYYWDSYWIINGLLVSEMHETVKGMLTNFLSLVDEFGFIPNGARVYYLNRSQPPLLTAMISNYLKTTDDKDFLKTHIDTIEKELNFWINNRLIGVEKDGKTYSLAHFDSESGSPRPESYIQDYNTANYFDLDEDKKELYKDLKSSAESGHDFSTRWFVDEKGGTDTNLTFIQTRRIIPVDLNAFLCQAFRQLSEFYDILEDSDKSDYWLKKSKDFQASINDVFYNEDDGIWYDWDSKLSQHRRYFFPTNFAPLWTMCYDITDNKFGEKATGYALNQRILDYQGGIPSSLDRSGEQWDFPNAWPPHQPIVIQGLIKSGQWVAVDVGYKLAENWINANLIGYSETGQMFEKYDAEKPGKFGGGGEYVVQAGFGWTNGVALEFIKNFYTSDN